MISRSEDQVLKWDRRVDSTADDSPISCWNELLMAYRIPRCQTLPLANYQTSFLIDGSERLRWHFGTDYPRPFFFPLNGPSGSSLTRMGHPGAPNHDHHQSIWFAHHKVLGMDFWANKVPPRIRQQEWLAYVDADDEAIMAVKLGWYDGHDPKELLEQELIVAVRPGGEPRSTSATETFVELQSTFRPTADMIEFGKTNFGFLAVRVAKTLSVHFGGGVLTNSEGQVAKPRFLVSELAGWTTADRLPTARSKGSHISITHRIPTTLPTGMFAKMGGWARRPVSQSH